MEFFIPILKVDAAKREVYGLMAEEAVDKSNEIFDYDSSKPYVKAWAENFSKTTGGKSFGNVRAQHSQIAAGKLIGIGFDDKHKQIPVCAKIVDDNEWKKVEEGVYTGFSIGGKYIKKWSDGTATRYTANPSEVSIVDNPCMQGAQFTMVKQDGSTELRKFAPSASSELAELKRLFDGKYEKFTELLQKVIKQKMTEVSAETRFHPQNPNEPVTHFVDGQPARKDLGHNPARNANIRKSADDGFRREVQPRTADSFQPHGVRKIDAENSAAMDLLKTARANRTPVR